MIHPERIKILKDVNPRKGEYVLYWMQQSQRAHYNHALEYAITQANELRLPVVVYFGLTPRYPEANSRHYTFMLQGLQDVDRSLAGRGISFIVRIASPEQGALELSKDAALVVTDRGYLRTQRHWRQRLAGGITCPLVQVEADVVVPVEAASDKEEYSAATLRRKITNVLPGYLVPLQQTEPAVPSTSLNLETESLDNIDRLIQKAGIAMDVAPSSHFHGGTSHALTLLDEFIEHKLKYYDTLRNDPSRNHLSHLSPYLHFGQISPLYIALKVMATRHSARDRYLEELIVRRELAMNFVYYNEQYDSYDAIPQWARNTLKLHAGDQRPALYSLTQLEEATTHDPYWNAAQKEMTITGKLHNYMRMYWGKKIMEWSRFPQEAFEIMVHLNNRYSLDGRDANSFTGIAWCFGKHDRPWKERPVFGSVRYMNEKGLRRKFDMDSYIERISLL